LVDVFAQKCDRYYFRLHLAGGQTVLNFTVGQCLLFAFLVSRTAKGQLTRAA